MHRDCVSIAQVQPNRFVMSNSKRSRTASRFTVSVLFYFKSVNLHFHMNRLSEAFSIWGRKTLNRLSPELARKHVQAALPWISRPVSFFSVLLCMLWSYVILWCGLDVFCLVVPVLFLSYFFSSSHQTIDIADWGVVEKTEFMAAQNNRRAKTSLIASVGFSHLPLSGPCFSLENNSPRMRAKWFEKQPWAEF